MDTHSNKAEAITELDLAAIDEALGDLEIDEVVEAQAVEVIADEPEVIEQIEELMDADVERSLEADIAKMEIYDEADAGAEIVSKEEVAADKPKKEKKIKVAGAAPAPRASRDVSALDPTAFVLTSDVPADLDANKAEVMRLRPSQKKIAEKFDNVLTALAAGRAPSIYTMACFRSLKAKGEVTSPELVKALMDQGRKDGSKNYSEGTARSQAGQIMALFSALKIAERAGNKLTLNPKSTLASALEAFI